MKTYQEFTEAAIDEGLKNIAMKFDSFMTDFQDMRKLNLDIKPLIKNAEWLINTASLSKNTPKDKISGLKRLVKALKSINIEDKKDRKRLIKIEKDFLPLLTSFNLGKHI